MQILHMHVEYYTNILAVNNFSLDFMIWDNMFLSSNHIDSEQTLKNPRQNDYESVILITIHSVLIF